VKKSTKGRLTFLDWLREYGRPHPATAGVPRFALAPAASSEVTAMPFGRPDPKEMGFYYSLAQVGLEMVVPIGLGAWLGDYFGVLVWGAIAGAVIGFACGLTHLLLLLKQHDQANHRDQKRDRS
jgi:hypothetical protein